MSDIPLRLRDEVVLFNPRGHVWAEHFAWAGERIVAQTAIGRATVSALAMNRPLIVAKAGSVAMVRTRVDRLVGSAIRFFRRTNSAA